MNVPTLKGDGFDKNRLSTAYIEGWFGLPENSISQDGHSGLTEPEFMGYVSAALSLTKRREHVTKDNFVTPSAEPVTKLKPNRSFVTPSAKQPCSCGCGIVPKVKSTGRRPKFASGACRTRYHRRNQ